MVCHWESTSFVDFSNIHLLCLNPEDSGLNQPDCSDSSNDVGTVVRIG